MNICVCDKFGKQHYFRNIVDVVEEYQEGGMPNHLNLKKGDSNSARYVASFSRFEFWKEVSQEEIDRECKVDKETPE